MQLIDWLNGWLIDWLIEGLIHWMVDWFFVLAIKNGKKMDSGIYPVDFDGLTYYLILMAWLITWFWWLDLLIDFDGLTY